MRIKMKNKIYESSKVIHPGGKDRFLYIDTSNGTYAIDCIHSEGATDILQLLLTKGWFDFSEFDYNNDVNDKTWFDYCYSKK